MLEALWFFGGAEIRILKRTPSEHNWYAVYGILSLCAVTLYTIGGWQLYMFRSTYELPIIFFIGLGIYLIGLIFINRFVLSQISFFDEKRKGNLFLALRFLLTIFNAFTISYLMGKGNITQGFSFSWLIIPVAIFDFLPFALRFFRKDSPYDYLLEIEKNKLQRAKKEKIEALRMDLDRVKKGEDISDEEVKLPSLDDIPEYQSTLYIKRIYISNVRSLEELKLDLKVEDSIAKIIAFIGDNGVGKSTILRSIALGITDESGAIALMKILDGPMIRNGESKAVIILTLVDKDSKAEYKITTTIKIDSDSGEETIRKNFDSKDPKFLNRSIFICGYGSQRSLSGDKSIQEYTVYDALKPIFSSDEKLLNAELLLLRENKDSRDKIINIIAEVIADSRAENHLLLDKDGIRINDIAANACSDGYKSTLSWVMDLFGRAIAYGMLKNTTHLTGIVLIDELEQHLHPRWQRLMIKRLKEQFPGIQFIITTHTPLLVAGASDFLDSLIFSLESQEGVVEAEIIKNNLLHDMHAGNILLEAFNLQSTKSPKSIERIHDFASLQSKNERSKEEEEELTRLKEKLAKDNQIVNKADEELKARIRKYL